jgi:hypothetical protein
MHFGSVAGRDLDLFSKPPHALGLFCAQQVALAGMMAHYFSGGSNFEALRSAAMRFQFYFCSWFSWHSAPRLTLGRNLR